jgi:hypothetical protein
VDEGVDAVLARTRLVPSRGLRDSAGVRARSFIGGEVRQGESPEWRPLELLLGSDELCAEFMWMFDVQLEDGTVLNAYKHRWTRCYFHLSDDATTFYYAGGARYGKVDPYVAVRSVFADWECMEPSPSERAALRALLERLSD